MKTLLQCPVCGYEGIENQFCPNCDTDVSVIRALKELKSYVANDSIKPSYTPVQIRRWRIYQVLGFILIFALAGVLGGGIYSLFRPNRITYVPILWTFPIVSLPSPSSKRTYIVAKGDNLSKIAQQFCKQDTSWRQIVDVNPHLSKRVNLLYIGEEITIPNC